MRSCFPKYDQFKPTKMYWLFKKDASVAFLHLGAEQLRIYGLLLGSKMRVIDKAQQSL